MEEYKVVLTEQGRKEFSSFGFKNVSSWEYGVITGMGSDIKWYDVLGRFKQLTGPGGFEWTERYVNEYNIDKIESDLDKLMKDV